MPLPRPIRQRSPIDTTVSAGNPSTIAANVALKFPESSGLAIDALIATGLVLFGITLVVNMLARSIIARAERGAR